MTTDTPSTDPLVLQTPPGRIAYPKSLIEEYGDAFKINLLFSKDIYRKDPQFTALVKKVDEFGKSQHHGQAFARPCLADGDKPILMPNGVQKDRPEFMKGHYIFTAKTKAEYGAPKVQTAEGVDILPNSQEWHEKVFPGALAAVEVKLYAYNRDGNAGVGAGLRHVWIVPGGVRMNTGAGSRSTPNPESIAVGAALAAQLQAEQKAAAAEAASAPGGFVPEPDGMDDNF